MPVFHPLDGVHGMLGVETIEAKERVRSAQQDLMCVRRAAAPACALSLTGRHTVPLLTGRPRGSRGRCSVIRIRRAISNDRPDLNLSRLAMHELPSGLVEFGSIVDINLSGNWLVNEAFEQLTACSAWRGARAATVARPRSSD